MKKAVVIFSLIVILAIFLIGCSGRSLQFTAQFKPLEYTSEGANSEFGKLFYSRYSLDMFYERDIFQGEDKQSELEKYDDEFFQDKALLIVMFLGDKNSNKDIKAISVNGNELWVTVQTSSMKEYNEISRFFIELDKEPVKNISAINYKMLTVI